MAKYGARKISTDKILSAKYREVKYRTQNIEVANNRTQIIKGANHRKEKIEKTKYQKTKYRSGIIS